MTLWILYILAGLLLVGATAFLLLFPGANRAGARDRPADPAEFFPVHCRFFPQVRQSLSREDAAFMGARASPAVRKRWERRRRCVGRMYLAGLREDFSRLNRLSRLLALHSPRVRARQEAELLWLNLRFQLLYGMVLSQILLGQSAAENVGHIASLIGGLGGRLEQAALTLGARAGTVTP
jgi:hypothetical protein